MKFAVEAGAIRAITDTYSRGSANPTVLRDQPLAVLFGKVLTEAARYVRIVDVYMDEVTVVDFVGLAAEGVQVQLLTGRHTGRHVKPGLEPSIRRFQAQYGASRPLEARLAEPVELHDRLIDIDGQTAWIVTQSFNAIASRSPATINRVEPDVATSKIAWYARVWSAAAVL